MKPAALVLSPWPDFLMNPLQALCVCHDYFDAADKEALIAGVAGEVRAIVMAGGGVAPVDLLERLPALEIVTVFGVGYDGVPVSYCQQRGIRVTNTPDVLTDDVA